MTQLIIFDGKIRLALAFSTLSNNVIKLKQNYNILYNLLQANCVIKDVYDVIVKVSINYIYFKDEKTQKCLLLRPQQWTLGVTSDAQAANLTKVCRF